MSARPLSGDEHFIRRGDRVIGLTGPRASSFTLAWLASHRNRLRSLVLGGHRLSLLIVWDREGHREVKRSDKDMDAIYQLTFGRWPPPGTWDEPEDDETRS